MSIPRCLRAGGRRRHVRPDKVSADILADLFSIRKKESQEKRSHHRKILYVCAPVHPLPHWRFPQGQPQPNEVGSICDSGPLRAYSLLKLKLLIIKIIEICR
jgi:hypothetical protein